MVPLCGGRIAAANRKVSSREGTAMMFLIRTAFWLIIIILLLPTDEGQQSKVYGTAEAAVKDVATFCDRNPDTCTTGRDAFQVLVHKDAPLSGMAPASWENGTSQDTLTPEDREAAWGGPDA
jgi:hypothetical protein